MRKWHCTECWEEFDEEDVGHRDEGIGPYEYWGIKGVDKQLVEVCPTCGEEVDEGPLPSCSECGEPLKKNENIDMSICLPCMEKEEKCYEEQEHQARET